MIRRLAAYEDTGLTPEEVALYVKCEAQRVSKRELELAAENERLRAQLEQAEDTYLTLDELKEMEGEPVYVVRISGAKIKMWVIACPNEYGLTQDRNAESQFMAWSSYGRVWLAYRCKPKEESK